MLTGVFAADQYLPVALDPGMCAKAFVWRIADTYSQLGIHTLTRQQYLQQQGLAQARGGPKRSTAGDTDGPGNSWRQ